MTEPEERLYPIALRDGVKTVEKTVTAPNGEARVTTHAYRI
jgi:hypothetical protein